MLRTIDSLDLFLEPLLRLSIGMSYSHVYSTIARRERTALPSEGLGARADFWV